MSETLIAAAVGTAVGALISFASTFSVQVWTKNREAREWLRQERVRAHGSFLSAVEEAQRSALRVRASGGVGKGELSRRVEESCSHLRVLSDPEMEGKAGRLAITTVALLSSSDPVVATEDRKAKEEYLSLLRKQVGV